MGYEYAESKQYAVMQLVCAVASLVCTAGLFISAVRGILGYVLRKWGKVTHRTVYGEFWTDREGSEPTTQVTRLADVTDEEEK
jgi:hypothetical protein